MNPYNILQQTELQRVSDGITLPILENCETASHILVLVWPQLGDFDSLEYAWWLQREATKFPAEQLAIRAVGIGDRTSGTKFCEYTGFSPQHLFMEPDAKLHQQLKLYSGLNLAVPGLSVSVKAWLNLMLMCAGLGSPGTLKEVFRGYRGDRQAPQLIGDDEIIQGTPLPAFKGSFFQLAGGGGFQRPFELATLRLRNMVEVLRNWQTYVPNSAYLTQRGGTFLFNSQGELLYEHRDPGILGFAANMSQPLSFLSLIDRDTFTATH
ncbi:AhpC/TSA family protein [Calothrix sp. FACHB-1219]|uniref:peroxiredoxin-like family protein n=1 Tax=unclassified Calothrix TaxID=2619626 RepID=UPI00168209C0|nr:MULTISPECIES: peroxiredoxin-like family protein [unclassified Calothrix]MBD2205903.1 AhpC/TSA family protein [Calothrix sp. FACHB-168]MBD2220732.1 AhpC/TSA family protein [Calothrix sp. FACHB-1219]